MYYEFSLSFFVAMNSLSYLFSFNFFSGEVCWQWILIRRYDINIVKLKKKKMELNTNFKLCLCPFHIFRSTEREKASKLCVGLFSQTLNVIDSHTQVNMPGEILHAKSCLS